MAASEGHRGYRKFSPAGSVMLWALAGPALALGLWMGWVQTITIPRLETKIETLTARRDRLENAIEDPVNGWRIRLTAAELNVRQLRGSINEQNDRLDLLAAAKAESDRLAAMRLAAVRAQRDEFERRVTAYRNIVPQADIPEQAVTLIRGAFGG